MQAAAAGRGGVWDAADEARDGPGEERKVQRAVVAGGARGGEAGAGVPHGVVTAEFQYLQTRALATATYLIT